MNATVITTGPGVIIETATASMNCRSVSQWNWRTTPPYRNGTIASPLPNTKRLAPAKYVRIFQSTPTDAGPPRLAAIPGATGTTATRAGAPSVRRPRRSLGPTPPEVDRERGRGRARGELRKGKALLVLLRADPAALLHEVLLHVPGERDRPAEPQGTESQEVEQQRSQAGSLVGHGRRLPSIAAAPRRCNLRLILTRKSSG